MTLACFQRAVGDVNVLGYIYYLCSCWAYDTLFQLPLIGRSPINGVPSFVPTTTQSKLQMGTVAPPSCSNASASGGATRATSPAGTLPLPLWDIAGGPAPLGGRPFVVGTEARRAGAPLATCSYREMAYQTQMFFLSGLAPGSLGADGFAGSARKPAASASPRGQPLPQGDGDAGASRRRDGEDARSLVFSPNLWASLLKSGENFSVPSRTGEAHTRNTGDPRRGGTRGAKTKSLRGTETTQPGVAPPTRSNFDWTNSLLKRSASRQVIELDPKYPRSCSTHNAKNFYKKLAHQHSQEARRFPMAPAGASC